MDYSDLFQSELNLDVGHSISCYYEGAGGGADDGPIPIYHSKMDDSKKRNFEQTLISFGLSEDFEHGIC